MKKPDAVSVPADPKDYYPPAVRSQASCGACGIGLPKDVKPTDGSVTIYVGESNTPQKTVSGIGLDCALMAICTFLIGVILTYIAVNKKREINRHDSF